MPAILYFMIGCTYVCLSFYPAHAKWIEMGIGLAYLLLALHSYTARRNGRNDNDIS